MAGRCVFGQVRTLRFHRDEFDKVFGAKRAPELLVVAGNHEWQGDWDFLKKLYKLPAGKTLRIAVRPISSLDTKGRAIGTVWPTAPKTVRPRWS